MMASRREDPVELSVAEGRVSAALSPWSGSKPLAAAVSTVIWR